MARKIIRVGNSLAVTIPSDILEDLGLQAGVAVRIELDRERGGIVILPDSALLEVDPEFDEMVQDIIDKYGPALESLAKR